VKGNAQSLKCKRVRVDQSPRDAIGGDLRISMQEMSPGKGGSGGRRYLKKGNLNDSERKDLPRGRIKTRIRKEGRTRLKRGEVKRARVCHASWLKDMSARLLARKKRCSSKTQGRAHNRKWRTKRENSKRKQGNKIGALPADREEGHGSLEPSCHIRVASESILNKTR